MNHPKKVTLSDLAIEALSKQRFDLIKEVEVVAKGTEPKKDSGEIIVIIEDTKESDDEPSHSKRFRVEIRTTLRSVLAFIIGLTLLIQGKLPSELVELIGQLFQ